MIISKQQQLLDELDEARIVLRAYRRGLRLATLSAVVFLCLILTGAVVGMWSTAAKVDFGGQVALLCILGSIGTVVSVGTGFEWYDAHLREGRSPAAQLRAAERAYRNHMLEQ